MHVDLGLIALDDPVDAGSHVLLDFDHGLFDRVRNPNRSLITDTIHADTDCAKPVVGCGVVGIFEPVGDSRYILEVHQATIVTRDNGDAAELGGPVTAFVHAEHDLAARCFDLAAGDFDR